jgi:uncharacterized membrane protein
MSINTVSLITGGLSFSAALAWNKAINHILTSTTKGHESPLTQAIVITTMIIIVVFIINKCVKYYKKLTSKQIDPSIESAGGSPESKVRLWDTVVK